LTRERSVARGGRPSKSRSALMAGAYQALAATGLGVGDAAESYQDRARLGVSLMVLAYVAANSSAVDLSESRISASYFSA